MIKLGSCCSWHTITCFFSNFNIVFKIYLSWKTYRQYFNSDTIKQIIMCTWQSPEELRTNNHKTHAKNTVCKLPTFERSQETWTKCIQWRGSNGNCKQLLLVCSLTIRSSICSETSLCSKIKWQEKCRGIPCWHRQTDTRSHQYNEDIYCIHCDWNKTMYHRE